MHINALHIVMKSEIKMIMHSLSLKTRQTEADYVVKGIEMNIKCFMYIHTYKNEKKTCV